MVSFFGRGLVPKTFCSVQGYQGYQSLSKEDKDELGSSRNIIAYVSAYSMLTDCAQDDDKDLDQFTSDHVWHDRWFSVLFCLCLLGVFALAFAISTNPYEAPESSQGIFTYEQRSEI